MKPEAELEERRQSLEESIDSLGIWMVGLTGVIVIGLSLELFFPVTSLIYKFDWRVLVEIIGTGLVTLGVAGELIAEFLAHRKERTLRSVNSDIEQKSNQLITESEQKAAEAYERAAIANSVAESEKLKRLELEKPLTPRDLAVTTEGTQCFFPLMQFRDITVEINYLQDQEVIRAVHSLKCILLAAKWNVTKIESNPSLNGRFYDGVVIFKPSSVVTGNPEPVDLADGASGTLLRFLRENNWTARIGPPAPDLDNKTLVVCVGYKSIPYLDPLTAPTDPASIKMEEDRHIAVMERLRVANKLAVVSQPRPGFTIRN